MGGHLLPSRSAMGKALILGETAFGTTLFGISATHPSVSWEWVRAILAELRLPGWVAREVH